MMTILGKAGREISICVLVTVMQIFSQSLASSLGNLTLLFSDTIAGISASNISGVAFQPVSKTLYIVDNKECAVYEITTHGRLIRQILLDGFEDTEGIAYHSGFHFYIVEERRADLSLILLPSAGNGSVKRDKSIVLHFNGDWKNSGLEGVAYSEAKNLVYVTKEKHPPRLYSVIPDNSGNPVQFEKNKPFNIEENPGDAADLFALSDGNFLVLNQELDKLIGYDPRGKVLSERTLGMNQAEGVTVDSSGCIYVVGEPKQFCVFGKQNH